MKLKIGIKVRILCGRRKDCIGTIIYIGQKDFSRFPYMIQLDNRLVYWYSASSIMPISYQLKLFT